MSDEFKSCDDCIYRLKCHKWVEGSIPCDKFVREVEEDRCKECNMQDCDECLCWSHFEKSI